LFCLFSELPSFGSNFEVNLLENVGDILYLTNDTNKISDPRLLTKQLHTQILDDLRKALSELKETKVENPGVLKMRIRNWLFLYEEGEPVVDIILDKGYSLADVEACKVPRQAETALTFDECTEIHKYLLTTNALDPFADDVNIRVGSPGSEPTLHDLEDFEASVGDMLTVETWQKVAGRSKYTMVLNEICDNKGFKVIVLVEGAHRFEVPLEDIKVAFALPFHPSSKSVKVAKDAARHKARNGAFKKSK
jgi:ribosome maturation factor RimP